MVVQRLTALSMGVLPGGGGGRMCVLDMKLVAGKVGFVLWVANRQILVSSPAPSMNSRTPHMHYWVSYFS